MAGVGLVAKKIPPALFAKGYVSYTYHPFHFLHLAGFSRAGLKVNY